MVIIVASNTQRDYIINVLTKTFRSSFGVVVALVVIRHSTLNERGRILEPIGVV